MEKLLSQLEHLRNKCEMCQDELNENFNANDDIRAGCFGMIYNHTVQIFELLNFYYQIWDNPKLYGLDIQNMPEKIIKSKKENGERVIMATQCGLFIPTISSIEFCAKEAIKCVNHPLYGWYRNQKRKQKRIHLSGIINESYKKRLITKYEKKKWDCIIHLRNIVVHNNGISDITKKYIMDDDLIIEFNKNKMTQGKLDIFIKLTNMAVELYYKWVVKTTK
jgi:hypothetical protein